MTTTEQPHTVSMYSEEYGLERFNYDSGAEAREGLARLESNRLELADGVERFYNVIPTADLPKDGGFGFKE